MLICFFGSRKLSGSRVQDIIKNEFSRLGGTAIVTASEPSGVCAAARDFASDNNIPLTTIPRQDDRKAGMYHHRSKMCFELCDHAVLIHDGESNGTQNEFELALRMSIPLTYHCLVLKGQIKNVVTFDAPTLDFITKNW